MPHKPKTSQKRQQIIQALYDCLATSGHEKVSVKAIAARAGVAPGVIHYYFQAKDDITIGLAESIISQYSRLLQEQVCELEPGQAQIDALLEFLINHFIFDSKLNRVFYNLIQMGFERAKLQSITRKLLAAYRAEIGQVFENAGVGQGRSIALGAALVALTEGLALQRMVDPKAFDKRQVRLLLKTAIKTQLN